ncbi:GNAT family acetyltransferase [Dongia soli]|uniref:GNAT family acetyltransferase n=1 Tax=Dongia soli TaxID=600628 RepID=A0ABU5EF59_9PROT|nr:GNAT family acetyltransferase [Dongia soli]MDY0885028.1 GNAT family acetyltransferase [Dongia soli]
MADRPGIETPSPAMVIRPYAAADFSAVVSLWDDCGLNMAYNDPQRDISRMTASQDCQLYVGTVEDAIVASIMVGHDGHRGWIYRLGVAPDHRHRGYGRDLMQLAENWLTARGIAKCQLIIREDNNAAGGFYKAIGYEDTPRRLMAKWLNADRPEMEAAKLDVVVTYLEMTSRPTRPSTPMPLGNYALLKLEEPTVAYYRYLYNTVGEPWFWYERREIGDAALQAAIRDPNIEIYVLHAGGVPAGYAEFDRNALPDLAIAYFGLVPDFIGRGLGKYFLNWAIDRAWSYEGVERVTVDTCTLDHPRALAAYQRAGFQPIRQDAKRIIDPRLKGLIPAWRQPRLPVAI